MLFEDRIDAACQLAQALGRSGAVPDPFVAVSRFYRSFSRVEDEEVSELLAA